MTERMRMIQALMEKNRVGAVLLWRPDELVMTLGYQPYWGISFALFLPDKEPILFIPAGEPKPVCREAVTVRTFPWGMLSFDPWDRLMEELRQTIDSCGGGEKPLGIVSGGGNTAPTALAAEQPALPGDLLSRLAALSSAGTKEISGDFYPLYNMKLPADLAALRLTHGAAADAIDVFYESLDVPGITEVEVKIRMESAVQRWMNRENITFAQGWAQVQSGENSVHAGKYNTTTGKRLAPGDLVMLEFAVCVNGYWCDLSRTGYVGEVSPAVQENYNLVRYAQLAALDCVRAGESVQTIYQSAYEVLEAGGFAQCFPHGLGHGVGFRYHDPAPALHPYAADTLTAGMVITVEPGIYGGAVGGGIRIEDNVLVTQAGWELLSNTRRGLKGEFYGAV